MNLVKILIILLCPFLTFQLKAQEFNPPFFVFEDGLWNAKSDEPEYWANLVKDVGFDGVELIGLDKLDVLLPELKKNNLQLFTLYIKIDIDKEEAYDPRLMDYIKKLRDKGLHLWIHVHSSKYSCSDPAGDTKCIEVVSELADYANKYGVKIAFYPHSNFWIEKVDDGIRLAEKIDKENVGVVFNLCHFLKKDEPQKLKQTLLSAKPHLFLVSINGADGEPETHNMGWDRLIQPLGKGTYDVFNVLQILKNMGYNKPIGLQCYNIKGEPEVFLKESMLTWKKYLEELNQ
ncbi:MAG: sugar phosphate isomerase/epimerase family protein [Draconibacterium sp.]|nr:sugar phosphate isomerase/epimerase family protein [Draconibacterium sp.]